MSPGDYASRNDLSFAPWRVFERMETGTILDTDGANYFIPYTSIRGISRSPGRKPTLAIAMATHTITLHPSHPEYVDRPLRAAQSVLAGRVPVTL